MKGENTEQEASTRKLRGGLLVCGKLFYLISLIMPFMHFGIERQPWDICPSSFSNYSYFGLHTLMYGWLPFRKSYSFLEQIGFLGWWANPILYLALNFRSLKPQFSATLASTAFLLSITCIVCLFCEQFIGKEYFVWHLHSGAYVWCLSMFLIACAMSSDEAETVGPVKLPQNGGIKHQEC